MDLTVDASVVAKWFFDEPHKDEADALFDLSNQFNAPALLVYEFASIVRKYTRHNKITEIEGIEALERFNSLSINYISVQKLYVNAYRIANELDHHIYDSFYLAITLLLESNLVTADKKFYNKVKSSSYSNRIKWIEDPPELLLV